MLTGKLQTDTPGYREFATSNPYEGRKDINEETGNPGHQKKALVLELGLKSRLAAVSSLAYKEERENKSE